MVALYRLLCAYSRISTDLKVIPALFMICVLIWLFASQLPHVDICISDEKTDLCSTQIETMISKLWEKNRSNHALNSENHRLCVKFKQVIKRKRNVVTDVFNNKCKLPPKSVTMVTHMGTGKMDRLLALLDAWHGPVSVTVLVEPAHLFTAPYSLCVPRIAGRKDLLLHLTLQEDENTFYPGNYLRNVALGQTTTEFVFLTDIDLLPSAGLYDSLVEHAKSLPSSGPKKVLVVPAFQLDSIAVRLPLNKTTLQLLINKHYARPFLEDVYQLAHRATNFTRWFQATRPYKVAWDDEFEPYILARREEMPSYYENIVGRYMDKVSHLMHVAALGYSFEVLPTVFVLHLDHARSINNELYRCAYKEYLKFRKTLRSKYVEFARIT